MFNGFTITHVSGYAYLAIITSLAIAGISLIVAFNHYAAKYFLITFINKSFDKKREGLGQILFNNHLFHRLAYLVPAFFLYHFSYLFDIQYPHLKLFLAGLIKELTGIYLLVGIALVISAILNCINERYNRLPIAKNKPIKSYLQVAKIFLFSITGMYVASILFDKSPAYFFTGVGATAAFLAIIFKDSVMGFIASIQLAAYDMVRIGDWIEMPNFGADGEVMDISLNTVKVQNFDKTIVTIPSYALLTSGLKNWRGMHEAGGRRVKRSIFIDINSIQLCEAELLEQIRDLPLPADTTLIETQIAQKQITNIGLFRFYLQHYLKQHPSVHKKMKVLIRQLQGTVTGLPFELYFFINQTHSEKFESIQSDILEHVYAILPRFQLRVFQYPSSTD